MSVHGDTKFIEVADNNTNRQSGNTSMTTYLNVVTQKPT